MGIPAGFARIVWSGTLASGETFETGFYVADHSGQQSDADTLAFTEAANVATDLGTWWGAHEATSCALKTVTAYCYPDGGPAAKYVGQAAVSGVVGTQSSNILPDQCCVCVTLNTGAAGRRNRGRMYVPLTSAILDSSAQIPQTTTDALAAAMATHLNRFASTVPGAVVVSQVASNARSIIQLVVDSRVDIQRRRADKQTIARRSVHSVP